MTGASGVSCACHFLSRVFLDYFSICSRASPCLRPAFACPSGHLRFLHSPISTNPCVVSPLSPHRLWSPFNCSPVCRGPGFSPAFLFLCTSQARSASELCSVAAQLHPFLRFCGTDTSAPSRPHLARDESWPCSSSRGKYIRSIRWSWRFLGWVGIWDRSLFRLVGSMIPAA